MIDAVLTWIAAPTTPVWNEVAVTTPVALTNDVRETSASKETSTPLLAAADVEVSTTCNC